METLAERFVDNILWYSDIEGKDDDSLNRTIEGRKSLLNEVVQHLGHQATSTGSVVFGAILTSPFEGTNASEATASIETLLNDIQKVRGDRQREVDFLRFSLGEITTNPIEEKKKFETVEENLKDGFLSVEDSDPDDSSESFLDETEISNE